MANTDELNEQRLELHLDIAVRDCSIVDLVASHCRLSKTSIKKAMTAGAVWLENRYGTQRVRRTGRKLNPGDRLHVYYDERVLAQQPPTAKLFADEQRYSVWYKPGGMFSQGSKWGDHCSITRWVETHTEPQRDARIVHRLDRATSGLMLIAHDKETAAALSGLFANRDIEKRYHAQVEGKLQVDIPANINVAVDDKPAESVVIVADYNEQDDHTDVLVQILTGRKHQVRKHMQYLGHPVLGDRLYGSQRLATDLQLLACYLAFRCPLTGENRCYQLPGFAQTCEP